MALDATRTLRGALAGTVAAAVWYAQQPLDRRVFGVDHDDAELLGRLVARGRPEAQAFGVAIHLQNGAAFGAVYAQVAPSLPGPAWLRGPLAGLLEHVATWPAMALIDPALFRDPRAFAQSAWRHALFGAVLGGLEALINDRSADEPPTVPYSSNGHGSLDTAVTVSQQSEQSA